MVICVLRREDKQAGRCEVNVPALPIHKGRGCRDWPIALTEWLRFFRKPSMPNQEVTAENRPNCDGLLSHVPVQRDVFWVNRLSVPFSMRDLRRRMFQRTTRLAVRGVLSEELPAST